VSLWCTRIPLDFRKIMNAPLIHSFVLILLPVVVLFFIYRRFRRHVGAQPLKPRRMFVRTLILSAAGVFLLTIQSDVWAQLVLLGAIGLGIALGLLNLHHTRFEVRTGQRYYVPNTYVGLAIVALFAVRMAYRLSFLYGTHPEAAGRSPFSMSQLAPPAWSSAMTTIAIMAIVIGFYATYFAGVLVHSRKMLAAR
jgi:membrane protein CcdC involved in cytochrome C biogenesis